MSINLFKLEHNDIKIKMAIHPQNLNTWIITEGMAGTQNQCLGVAQALGVTPNIKQIKLKGVWKFLSPFVPFETKSMFDIQFVEPWPDLLITSGRKAIAASRYIKKMSAGKTFTVHIQDPRVNSKYFDLVAVPFHDPMRGDNVIVTKGAPNRITPALLARARNDFAHLFAMMTSPHIAVLIGGNSKAHTMTDAAMEKLGAQLAKTSGSLMITSSRRTSPEQRDALLRGLGDKPHWYWDGTGENPYMGMLAWADYILVTADSVSMLSDAATTGKPVYMIPMDGGSKRFDKFHDGIIKSGAVRKFDGVLEHWNYEPFNDSALVAGEIIHRMAP